MNILPSEIICHILNYL